jgi:hypothetical protein
MSHILRPPSEKTFSLADALAGVPRCVLLVESAFLAVVDAPDDEKLRQKALGLLQSLSQGCPECGFREPVTVLRKLTSLLAVRGRSSAALQRSAADRMIEQIGVLKAHAQQARSSS